MSHASVTSAVRPHGVQTTTLSAVSRVRIECAAATKTEMSDAEAASSSSDPNAADMQDAAGKGDAFVEPEKKRRRVSQSVDRAKNKLEERLGGILCCAVCLDLPKAAVYQVSRLRCVMQPRRSRSALFVLVSIILGSARGARLNL